MDEKVEQAFNAQIKHELDSAYIYLAMCAQFEAANLPGFARWMRMQAQEEVGHAMRLYEHVNDRGGRVILEGIDKPPTEFGTPVEVFEKALNHERKVSALIRDLYEVAVAENDYAAQIELQWFITEQVEEEKSAGDIVDQLRMVGENTAALLMMDRQLGARTSHD